MSILVPEIVLIDGENLTLRYQAMLAEGWVPHPSVAHYRDVFVWNGSIFARVTGDIRRVSYYTSTAGDETRYDDVCRQIRGLQWGCMDGTIYRNGHFLAKVFRKSSKKAKSRSVDINIVVDAMRAARNGTIGGVRLISGDGDFVTLAEELSHAGVLVHVMALSSGLSPRLENVSDELDILDREFFSAPPPPKQVLRLSAPIL